MADITEEWFKTLSKPRRHRQGKHFTSVRLAREGELLPDELAYVTTLRRRGLRAEVFVEDGTGYRVGVYGGRHRSDDALRNIAMNQMAHMEFQNENDFDLFKVIASEARTERLERFYKQLDKGQQPERTQRCA